MAFAHPLGSGPMPGPGRCAAAGRPRGERRPPWCRSLGNAPRMWESLGFASEGPMIYRYMIPYGK